MECQEMVKSVKVSDTGNTYEMDQPGSGNLNDKADELLEYLDLYWDDINDRLTISRMVSESVIKGMVNAVEQECNEKIAAKEMELVHLKERFQFSDVGMDRVRSLGFSWIQLGLENMKNGLCLNFSDAFVDCRKRDYLGCLSNMAKKQVEKLKENINGIRGCSLIRRSGSGTELVGLGHILQEKDWVGVDRKLESLSMTLDTICTCVDDVLQLSTSTLHEWQQEQEFRADIEYMVIQSSIRSLQEEFEEKLWDQNACSSSSRSISWLEKFDKLSSLKKELEAIFKSLSNPEFGQPNGSHDMDPLHRKASGNHVSSADYQEGNGKLEEPKSDVPESFDISQLKCMSKDEMVNYFNTMMTKLRRNHEFIVREKTEKYYILKREYLNYKDQFSSLLLKKEKEFDILREKIPEVVLKLDEMLAENEKLLVSRDSAEDLGNLRSRPDNLLSENCQRMDLLTDKKKEVKCLLSQVSDASDKMLEHSLSEENLLRPIANLNLDLEDAKIEASIGEEVFKCVLKELSGLITCNREEPENEFPMLQELDGIILGEAAHAGEGTRKCEIEDLDVDSLVIQGLYGVILGDLIKDVEEKIKEFESKFFTEIENQLSLEEQILVKDNQLKSAIEGQRGLKKEVIQLMEEKKLATEMSDALMRERNKFEVASLEQCTVISESRKEINLLKGKLEEAFTQNEVNALEMSKVNRKLEKAMDELMKAEKQRKMLHALAQEKQNDLLLVEEREKEHRNQLKGFTVLVKGLSGMITDFECRVASNLESNYLRLKDSSSQLSSLGKKAIVLRTTGLLYKQRLERKCADLQTAEAEVDLLGDKVEVLLSLLEKIYIALDHYSPVLQHYPGIVEILKLVKREINGESTKLT